MAGYCGAGDIPLPGAGWWTADRDMWLDSFDPLRPVESETFSRLYQAALIQELQWLYSQPDDDPFFVSWSALLRLAALLALGEENFG